MLNCWKCSWCGDWTSNTSNTCQHCAGPTEAQEIQEMVDDDEWIESIMAQADRLGVDSLTEMEQAALELYGKQ